MAKRKSDVSQEVKNLQKALKAGLGDLKDSKPLNCTWSKRPTCPECNSSDTFKNGGIRSVCKNCGKSFSRKPRPKQYQGFSSEYLNSIRSAKEEL
jgi:hypothetical protein